LIFVVNVIFLITIDATLENWGKRKDIDCHGANINTKKKISFELYAKTEHIFSRLGVRS
jgi:hypothetical protein